MTSSPLLSAAEALANPVLRYLDVRSQEAYDAGHLPDAIHLVPKAWRVLAKAAETGLEDSAGWLARFAGMGIDRTTQVAIYDDGTMTEAARAWFILQYFGINARVVNGGWPFLLNGAPLASRTASEAKQDHDPSWAGLIDRVEVLSRLQQSDSQIWDARTQDEYTGIKADSYARGGHIPGAVSIDHRLFFAEDGGLLPGEMIGAILEQHGLDRTKRLITHCGSGGRGSFAGLAAAAAGFSRVDVYYLGFSDWAADDGVPVDTIAATPRAELT
ncbi:sulfurtransferase [Jeongeupia chitinilytica]|uniref:Rhodanese domain-containing protein n=1 Tax=Jeongeupia chitinilytica TaxID=1041641 RepID=A0ABQ3GVV1_9NEIS|nr:rhodanese-like domain-containing protein [Jeongeupia chitinilytica]GHD57492.1 hypothetical protein GCM10007350_06250 [Jeongeupia chitinilytica]